MVRWYTQPGLCTSGAGAFLPLGGGRYMSAPHLHSSVGWLFLFGVASSLVFAPLPESAMTGMVFFSIVCVCVFFFPPSLCSF